VNLRFSTPRLQVMDFTADDVELLHHVTGDAEVMRHFPKPLSLAETSAMLQKILEHYSIYGYCFWKMVGQSHHDFIGIVGILHQEIEGRIETEVAYRTAKKYWNRGHATEAALGCIRYARESLGKTRLISLIRPENAPSIRVAEKLGARIEKTIAFKGLVHGVYVYGVENQSQDQPK
jgi:[ribosomal protein S5]-alanine N-acetyltransferase